VRICTGTGELGTCTDESQMNATIERVGGWWYSSWRCYDSMGCNKERRAVRGTGLSLGIWQSGKSAVSEVSRSFPCVLAVA
jgi:hypothetical protein